MDPTSEELAEVILTLGDEEELTEGIRKDVRGRLVEMGWIQFDVGSAPVLTKSGEKAYSKMIDGSDVPELEFDWPEGD
jgi:hypothetical protein